MTYFTLHSHNLIFITFTKTWFPWLFHSCCVCIFCCIHTCFVLIFMSKPSHCRNTTLFHIHVHWSIPLILIRTFARFSKHTLSLVWKRFCWFIVWKRFWWFIPSFSFLSCVRIFYIFSFITHSKCVLSNKIFCYSIYMWFYCDWIFKGTQQTKHYYSLSQTLLLQNFFKQVCSETTFKDSRNLP